MKRRMFALGAAKDKARALKNGRGRLRAASADICCLKTALFSTLKSLAWRNEKPRRQPALSSDPRLTGSIFLNLRCRALMARRPRHASSINHKNSNDLSFCAVKWLFGQLY